METDPDHSRRKQRYQFDTLMGETKPWKKITLAKEKRKKIKIPFKVTQ